MASKPMKGLLLLAGKPPSGKSMPAGEDDDAPESKPGGSEDISLSDAFQAVQDGDEGAFKAAMVRAIRACIDEDY